jgi:hypothetical protein
MPSEIESSTSESLRGFVLLAVAVAIALVAYALAVASFIAGWPERGQFGDMFGAANALFSGLAFSALVYALVLQRRELSLQRIELSLTRGELSKQSEAQTQQAATSLRAARISALGALLQSYGQLVATGHNQLVDDTNYQKEILRVKGELLKLLNEQDA